jgi:hypothetical protein
MSPLPDEVNRGMNSRTEKVVKSEINTDLPLMASDLVY